MEPAKKKQRRQPVEINRTELVMYMAWRLCWFECQANPGMHHHHIPVGKLYRDLANTVRFMGMENDACVPNPENFMEILDTLCQKNVLRIRDNELSEACVFLFSDKTGRDIENSILEAQFGVDQKASDKKKHQKAKYKVTESIRILHARFFQRAMAKSMGQLSFGEDAAPHMKQARE